MDEYRFRTQQSPRNEAPMNSLVSPQRNGRPMPQPVSQDPRTTLPRRFTTDSGRVPTLSTISTQRLPEPQEYTALEKKKIEYEKLREQKRRFEAEMHKLDQQQRRDEFDIAQMQEDLVGRGNGIAMTGHQSEPTTPPEYRETSSGFPTMFSRPNRYSTPSLGLVSPPGLFTTRSGRSGSQLTSPQSGILQSRFFDDPLPSRSVPGSRRNSDEDEKEEALRQDPTSHRSTNALNRYSMPVTRRGNLYDNIDQTNTAGFLFRDDESSIDLNSFASMDANEDNFPQLYAQKGNPNVLSASSAAVDLASQLPSGETTPTNGWGSLSRHRQQQSLTTLGSSQLNTPDTSVTGQSGSSTDTSSIASRSFRHSLDMSQYRDVTPDSATTATMSPSSSSVLATPPKLQTSFSAGEVPTIKSVSSATMTPSTNANAHANNHLHHHNASIGRFPNGVPTGVKRHSRELSADTHIAANQAGAGFPTIQSALQGNAPAFGPIASSQAAGQAPASNGAPSSGLPPVGYNQQFYNGYGQNNPNGNGYGMNMLTMGIQNMGMNNFPPQNYGPYGPVYQGSTQPRDSQQRVIQQRRAQDSEAMNRYANMSLEQAAGQIYGLCKDQFGCRYLQKQLENRLPDQVHMIWQETNQHIVDLMTDPFGNYLCQKLLEYCTDDERTVLIQNASPKMVEIAKNAHGTRALQKMIESVSTPTHVQLIIQALGGRVVELIQDINGNHVIQKCLNKLNAQGAQFIFTAVGNRCIDVGTHRHGCCVLQRCIDHASGDQKMWLISKITENATRLVQDPFGNYVVQYIIDLNDTAFTEPLVQQFRGRICQLSRHKFSSNVIEKCLRCGNEDSKDLMVNELLSPGEMDRLLRDNFGNYVVQTALEHATQAKKMMLVEAIRPHLTGIRHTPYGRRLQAKVQQHDTRGVNGGNVQTTAADGTQGQVSLRAPPPPPARTIANPGPIPAGLYNGLNGTRGRMPYPSNTTLAVAGVNSHAPPQPPRLNQYSTYPGAGVNINGSPSENGGFI
ncbi:ARM repeat-containing protein [Hypoxylon rubiginosum]|uniref:ARM repeat-containing protein n=1 Tax=Hypoxylon rubiginosum TaxID=110542 RepID=A0ACB9ZB69_9PEZI|nr:ARM repeat-containing protein [Hypoxylon rubiginosum]